MQQFYCLFTEYIHEKFQEEAVLNKENKGGGKKGYTLLELIIVLSIMSIGTFIISPNLKVFSEKKERIEMDYAVDGLIEFIDEGKSYGRLKDKSVAVKFRSQDVVLMENLKIIDKFTLPPSVYVIAGETIDISGMGKIKKAQSIKMYNKSGTVEPETITIKVGTSYVSRQKK